MGSDLRVAIHAFASPPRMVIFGAIDFSAALARIATEIGYAVTIVDARQAFAASPRFAEHAEVVVSWPAEYLRDQVLGPRDAVLVFTHDPKFDEPALTAALETGAGYIGALGEPPHARGRASSASSPRACARTSWPGSTRRAASTSARARRRRRRSRSSARCSRCGPGAAAAASPSRAARSTRAGRPRRSSRRSWHVVDASPLARSLPSGRPEGQPRWVRGWSVPAGSRSRTGFRAPHATTDDAAHVMRPRPA